MSQVSPCLESGKVDLFLPFGLFDASSGSPGSNITGKKKIQKIMTVAKASFRVFNVH